jgi:hypothetical protein
MRFSRFSRFFVDFLSAQLTFSFGFCYFLQGFLFVFKFIGKQPSRQDEPSEPHGTLAVLCAVASG